MAGVPATDRRLGIGFDVGGSGIKAGLVDIAAGELVGERLRVRTPDPSDPAAVAVAMHGLLEQLTAGRPAAAGIPVGVGFPAAVIGGVTRTAANVDRSWVGYPAELELARRLEHPVAVGNDADVAGLAEMRFGAGRGAVGTVMVLTIGTGIGSALFVDGRLVPNTELGHLEMRGKDAERRASDAARMRRKLSWGAWAKVFDEYLHLVQHLFWPDLFILGGGVSKRSERFVPRLTIDVPVVPAQLLNDAGIVGAAIVAHERFGRPAGRGRGRPSRGPAAARPDEAASA